MEPRFSRYLGIVLLTVGIVGAVVTSTDNSGGFLADPGWQYPPRPGGPPWSSQFGPYTAPYGWQDPQNLYTPPPQGNIPTPPVPGPYWNQPDGNQAEPPDEEEQVYESNGESIYYTLTTAEGEPVIAQIRNMGRFHRNISCSSCHGTQGQGGYVEMGRESKVAPAIDWETLSKDVGGDEMLRPAYTESTLGRAITQGIDSAGRILDYLMPRFQLADQDLADLIDFLKTL